MPNNIPGWFRFLNCSFVKTPYSVANAMNVLGPSLAPYIRSSRTLKKYVTPVAHWYANLMGYRKMGLKYDDLRACHMFSSGMNVFKLDSCRGRREPTSPKGESPIHFL